HVQTATPDVPDTQQPPQVTVQNPEPTVQVQTGKPQVNVLPAEKPNVTINQTGKPDVNVGSTSAPGAAAPAAGTAAVAPAAGTFPAAKEVEKFIGKDVYGADGKKVGELNNLLINSDGRVRAGVVEFGGFLGIGNHKVAVPWNEMNTQGDRLTVNMTEDQIKSAPNWSKDQPNGEFAQYQPYR
ncbi:MAG: PRC-barrel domain-containing protein, partial [Alphaproteobacteria bacterium]